MRRRFMGGNDPYMINYYFTSTDKLPSSGNYILASDKILDATIGGKPPGSLVNVNNSSTRVIRIPEKVFESQVYVTDDNYLSYIKSCSKATVKVNNHTFSFIMPSIPSRTVKFSQNDFPDELALDISNRNQRGERNQVTIKFIK